ncbi:extracellular solute-binding protein [Erysipelothrix urinaevulpis]|uniref:extracellular solute-binding protein n=1 Tax=Erysipelothrix urinaevulpis TaxID=2683717 RepID=UPI00135803CD|nr:extracellular solute-binding protein [Erysipelothrix urinaevulpis]
MKKTSKFIIVLLLVFALVGCSGKGKDEPTEVVFWHAMNGAQEETLTRFAEGFMEENKDIKITLQNQGKYNDLQAKLNSTFISPKDLPTITQAYPNWLWDAAKEGLLVDMGPIVKGIENSDDINKDMLGASVIEGVQYGIPFNKSVEVLYYNADMLTEYGVEVPTTMEELATASKTIFEKSEGKVVGAGFDSLNNYYAIGMKNAGVDFNKDLDVTGQESEDVVNFYFEGVKEGYFKMANSGEYLSTDLGGEVLAMNIGSIAGESHVAKAAEGKFEFGISNRPSEINLSQGTDIYMFKEATEAEQAAAAKFIEYLVSGDVQLDWALSTGYIPVRNSVIADEKYSATDKSKAPHIVGDATEKMFTIPVIENADPAYNLGRDMMSEVLADKNTDVKKVLADYQTKMQAAWNQ